jgi:hypothetical protein
MSHHKGRTRNLISGKPIGDIKPTGNNGYGTDEAGRIYKYMPIEQEKAIERERQKQNDKRHFSFSHMRYIRDITDNLPNKVCGYILLLQPYLKWNTNVLIDDKENPLDEKGLAKALKVQPRTGKEVIKRLVQEDVLDHDNKGNYVMNNRYHFRKRLKGDEKSVLIKTFFTSLKGLNLKPAELGALYKLLPYVHYETNMICANPFEEYPQDIRFLNTKEIAELLKMDEKKTINLLRELKKGGAVAETTKFVNDRRTKYITLNPFIFYRQSGQPDASLCAMFLSKPNKQ